MSPSLRHRVFPALTGICAAALVFALAGCSTTKIHTEHNAAVNFTTYKTFAILPPAATGAASEPGVVLRLTEPVEQAVRESLTGKGLTEADRENADCAVRVTGEAIPRVQVTDWGYLPYSTGLRRRGWVYHGWTHDVDVTTTTDRRLIVEIYDGQSRKQAWVGWIENSGNDAVVAEKVQAGIHHILANFPPPPKSSKANGK